MKYLSRSDFLNLPKTQKVYFSFGGKTEINSELVDLLKSNQKEEDEKQRITEAKKLAIDSLGTLNPEITKYIEDGVLLRDLGGKLEGKSIDALKSSVRESVLSALKGEKTSPTRTPPISTPDYLKFINDIDKGTSEAISMVGNAEFAVTTLSELKLNYERQAQSIAGTKSDKNKLYKRFWKNFGGNRRENTSEQYIFETRNKFVMDVFNELEGKLAEKLKDAEAEQKEIAKKVQKDYEELLSPEEQAQLQEIVTEELETGTNQLYSASFNPDLAQAMFGPEANMPIEKRIRIYKELGWDVRSIDTAMDRSTQDYEKTRQKGVARRKGLNKTLNSLNIDKLKTTLTVSDDTEIPENSDLEGLLDELRPYMQQYGNKNVNPAFEYFKGIKNFEPNSYQEFTAYAWFLANNSSSIDTWLNKDLKIKILGYLKYIDSQEGVESGDDKFSDEFMEFEEKTIKPRFDKAQTLIGEKSDEGLQSLEYLDAVEKDLGGTGKNALKNIENYLVEHVVFVDALDTMSNKLTSQKEKDVLAEYLEQLEKIKTQLETLKKKWEETQEKYEQQEERYEKALLVLKKAEGSSSSNKVPGPDGDVMCPPEPEASDIIKATKRVAADYTAYKKKEKAYDAFKKALGDAFDAKPKDKSAIKITTISATDIQQLELDIKKVDSNITDRPIHNGKVASPASRFTNYIKSQSAIQENEELDKELEVDRKNQFELLKAKNVGSSVDIEFQEILYGNTSTTYDTLNRHGKKAPEKHLPKFSILKTSKSGVILTGDFNGSEKIVFVQEDKKSGKIKIIGIPAPKDVAKNGVPADFDPTRHSDFVGSPTSILPN